MNDVNISSVRMLVAALGAAAVVSSTAIAADRTVTYEAPYAENNLLSNAETGVLTLDESAYPVDAAHALSFTGFVAVAKSTTVFNGGWWDFGGGLFPTNAASDRTVTLQNGAVVTNVASMPPSNHYRNKFRLLGASRLYIAGDAVVDYGESGTHRSNEVHVAEGSSLIVGGDIITSYCGAGSNAHRKEGVIFEVTGVGSYAKAKGLNMNKTANNANGSPGDARVVVSDHGILEIANTFDIAAGSRTFNNRLYVTDGGVVTAATVNLVSGYGLSYDKSSCGCEVHVLNGGSLRANTKFNIGYTSSSSTGKQGMSLVVSNGTFSAAKMQPFGLGSGNSNIVIRISGPDAKFHIDNVTGTLFGQANKTGWNKFVVENRAKLDFPWTSCSYTDNSANNTILVTGADTVLTLKNSFSLSSAANNSTSLMGFTNRFCIVDGGVVTGAFFHVAGDAGTLSVSNGTLLVSNAKYDQISSEPAAVNTFPAFTAGVRFRYGGASTNCVVRFSGTSPRIACVNGASADVRGSTKLIFDIPETCYDYGSDDYVPFDVAGKLTINNNCEIVVNGLTRAARNAIAAKGGSVPLIRAKTLNIGNALLASAQAALPAGCKLKLVGTAGKGQTLMCSLTPGLLVLFE
jgi:hypothetical protein